MINDLLKDDSINNLNDLGKVINQQRNGMYFLPDNLTDFVATIIKKTNPKSCINLNSNLGEILSKLKDIDNSIGLDLNTDNIKVAKHFNPEIKFENINPLNFQTDEKFDAVISFPILGQKIEVSGKTRFSEELYIEKALDLVNENGKVILILPEIFLSGSAFKEIRNTIIATTKIERIIDLPKHLIGSPLFGHSIIVLNKRYGGLVNFSKINEVSFTNYTEILNKHDFSIETCNLAERWDYFFHNPSNKEYEKELEPYKTQAVSELVEIVRGVPISSDKRKENGELLLLNWKNISNGELQLSTDDEFIDKKGLSKREQNAVLKIGDIVLRSILTKKQGFYLYSDPEKKIIAPSNYLILRGENAEYVATYLNTASGIKLFHQQIDRHVIGLVLNIKDLQNIQIPILPLDYLKFASKSKLEKLPYQDLINIKEKYELLQIKYQKLEAKSSKSAHQQQLDAMQEALNKVLQNQKVMAVKLDEIQASISQLSIEFKSIKDLPRDIEEKIFRLNESIDKKLNSINIDRQVLDSYVNEISRWFDFYDLLELKSKKYLPEAEYLYDQLSKLENPDYSPFILQYCRAFENELLIKVFRTYVQSLIDREIDIETFFAWDLGKKDSGKPNSENSSRLAKHLKRCLKRGKEQWFFELGYMEVNLRYLTGKTVEKSPLLLDLKTFILERFEQELLSNKYLDDIKIIINEYRNKSAHPNLINAESAVEFHKQIKNCLINLMENYKD